MAGSARTRPRSFWRESLAIMEKHVALVRRKVRADERVYLSGEPFDTLFLVNSGLFRLDNLAYDGREQSVGIYLKGDWLGFDGIATGRHACSAIALDSASVAILNDDLRLINTLIKSSSRCFSIIRQNLVWAFSYNLIALPLAVSGVLHPIISALLMVTSSLVVVSNSLRLKNL